ncbi:MAG: hypothetical protein U5L05_08935 [Rubrivivax sp.]|nr:hypothetical protein [Rubrivivax sp.]
MKAVFDFAGVLFRWQPVAMLQRERPHLASDEASARRTGLAGHRWLSRPASHTQRTCC